MLLPQLPLVQRQLKKRIPIILTTSVGGVVIYLLYCPGQAPMGARGSSTKIWGWVVTRRKCLNGSTIPKQGPTSDAKLAAMGPNRQFVCASSRQARQWRRLCRATKQTDSASLLSFRSVQSSPAICKFRAAGEEHCKRGHGQVCANLMSWRPKLIRTISAMWAQRTYLQIHYARI